MRQMIKDLDKKFCAPTPKKWKRLGNSLLGVSTMVTGMAMANEVMWVAYLALFTGVIGKFLTDFFTIEEGSK